MEFKLLPEGPLTNRKIMGHMLLLAALIAIIFMATNWPRFVDYVSQSESAVRTNKIRSALTQCQANRNVCIGAFVRYRFNNHILRIDDCYGANCRSRELPVAELAFWTKVTDLNEIHSIVLPDDPEWSKAAVAYEKQFVVSKQHRP